MSCIGPQNRHKDKVRATKRIFHRLAGANTKVRLGIRMRKNLLTPDHIIESERVVDISASSPVISGASARSAMIILAQ